MKKKIAAIKPYFRNPNKNHNIEAIKHSLKNYGQQQPIVVDQYNVIVVGHGRYEAMKQLGWEECEVWVMKGDEKKIHQYRITDNTSNDSEIDLELVKQEIEELNLSLEELTIEGLDLCIDDINEEDLVEDEVPEVPEDPTSKYGEVYQLGNHRLMCGDSTKSEDIKNLMADNKADMVFIDPPYNVNFSSTIEKNNILNDNLPEDEFNDFLCSAFEAINGNVKDNAFWYVCCNWVYYHIFIVAVRTTLKKVHTCIVWKKDLIGLGQAYRNQHEFILFASNNKSISFDNKSESNVFEYPSPTSFKFRHEDNAGESKLPHPTMKPIALIAKTLKNSSKKGDVILDSFGGSGSTLMACEQTNRHCYMIELDPKYVDVIITRWEKFTGEKAKNIS